MYIIPADWEAHGKAAGPRRNRKMAEYAAAVIALWDGKSRGTRNMLYVAHEHGLEIYLSRTDGEPSWRN